MSAFLLAVMIRQKFPQSYGHCILLVLNAPARSVKRKNTHCSWSLCGSWGCFKFIEGGLTTHSHARGIGLKNHSSHLAPGM